MQEYLNDNYSSEAKKAGIVPKKPESEMTEQDWFEFRNSLDPDMMGFDGPEGMELKNDESNKE